ncbi:hypothetical protein BC831DRAFT_451138 [Entophlyctis helioformis]|nr:hypothetical protein BC831DRAFT_451138 [Entophlyctis helioformis]
MPHTRRTHAVDCTQAVAADCEPPACIATLPFTPVQQSVPTPARPPTNPPATSKPTSNQPLPAADMDGNTPPIFLTYDPLVTGGDYETDKRTAVVAVLVFASVVLAYLTKELTTPLLSAWWAAWTATSSTPASAIAAAKERRRKEEMEMQHNAERFTRNFHQIITSLVALSLSPRELLARPSKLLPYLFLVVWLVSVIVIQDAIGGRASPEEGNRPILKIKQAHVGLILFFIAVNGYLIDRILSYYKDRTDNRKKVQAGGLSNFVQQESGSSATLQSMRRSRSGSLADAANPNGPIIVSWDRIGTNAAPNASTVSAGNRRSNPPERERSVEALNDYSTPVPAVPVDASSSAQQPQPSVTDIVEIVVSDASDSSSLSSGRKSAVEAANTNGSLPTQDAFLSGTRVKGPRSSASIQRSPHQQHQQLPLPLPLPGMPSGTNSSNTSLAGNAEMASIGRRLQPSAASSSGTLQQHQEQSGMHAPPPDMSVSDSTENFDGFFSYRRRIKHISPQFTRISLTFPNMVECLVLITEFIQLSSFPLRDLLRNLAFQQSLMAAENSSGAAFVQSLRQVVSALATGLPSINTRFLSTVQFAIAWWSLLFAFIVAAVFTNLYYLLRIEWVESTLPPSVLRRVRQILSGAWIMVPLPLINLFYLVILTAFIDPLGCLTDNDTPLWPAASLNDYALAIQGRMRQCLPIHDGNPPLQTWFSLSGFMMGYFLLTICRTANEPVPRDGAIQYTSRSELLFKNAAVVLLLLYVLVPSEDTTTARGIVAIFLLSGMILYSVVIGSSYAAPINIVRTISFMCVLWMTMVVVYYTHDAHRESMYLTGPRVFTPIAVGWIVIGVVYVLAYYLVIHKLQQGSQQPRRPSSSESMGPQSLADVPKDGLAAGSTTTVNWPHLRVASVPSSAASSLQRPLALPAADGSLQPNLESTPVATLEERARLRTRPPSPSPPVAARASDALQHATFVAVQMPAHGLVSSPPQRHERLLLESSAVYSTGTSDRSSSTNTDLGGNTMQRSLGAARPMGPRPLPGTAATHSGTVEVAKEASMASAQYSAQSLLPVASDPALPSYVPQPMHQYPDPQRLDQTHQ